MWFPGFPLGPHPCKPLPWLRAQGQGCDKRDHYQSHLGRFDFLRCIISWGGHNNGSSCKRKILPPSIFDKCIFSPFHSGFGCLWQQEDDFLHQRANMTWLAKGTDGPPLAILHAFSRQRVLEALQKTHVISILGCAIIATKGSSKLSLLSCFLFPFFL